jgi:SAM-dependent methyltransferase
MATHQDHHAQAHSHTHSHDDSGLAEVLELDAQVLRTCLTGATEWIAATADTAPARILDLGCGTGTGTFALLERFPDAEVVAVDASPAMLERVTARAAELGLGARLRTVQADLDAAWPAAELGEGFDVAWAAASMHHMASPQQVLTDLRSALRPGGLLALLEMDGFPRFLPVDLGPGFGEPGLEARAHAVLDAERAEALPHFGADWTALLTAAGFTVADAREFHAALPRIADASPEQAALVRRYAAASLGRVRDRFDGRLPESDLAALDTLLDPHAPTGIAHRDDLSVTALRTAWLARA